MRRLRNIYRRADGKYEVGYRDVSGVQRWRSPFDTRDDAIRWRDAALAERELMRRV